MFKAIFSNISVLSWRSVHIIQIYVLLEKVRVRVIVFNATFNNISAISWRSVLLVEETGVSEENQRIYTVYEKT